MKILHLYKDYFPVLGGIENHIKGLAEAQAARGHDVTVLVCNPGRYTLVDIINDVTIIKAGRLTTAASMPLSIAQPLELARQKPDIIHIQSPYPLGEVANWLLRRAKGTVISYQSDIVKQKNWLRLYGPFLRRVLQHTDRILTTTPRYIESSPWLQPVKDKCDVVPIGIDVGRFNANHKTVDNVNDNVSDTTDLLHLLFVGRLRYYKGLDTLLNALPNTPNVHLTIVGIGPMENEWRTLTETLGLTDRVTFAGEINDETLPTYYRNADVFVLPANARAEAYGIVLIEAMASGLPCLTTELGTGTSWIVQHGQTGLVVPPMDPAAMATAINSLNADAGIRQQFGLASLERASSVFSIEAMVDKVMSIYEDILS